MDKTDEKPDGRSAAELPGLNWIDRFRSGIAEAYADRLATKLFGNPAVADHLDRYR